MKTQSYTPSCRIGGTPKSLLCELGLPNSCTSATRHRTPRRRGLCLLVSPVNGQKLAHFTAPPLLTKSLILRGPLCQRTEDRRKRPAVVDAKKVATQFCNPRTFSSSRNAGLLAAARQSLLQTNSCDHQKRGFLLHRRQILSVFQRLKSSDKESRHK